MFTTYLTRNFRTHAFNLATRVFSLLTRKFELVTRGFELVTRGFELVTRVSLFHRSHWTLVVNFDYFISYLQTKTFAWKRDCPISLKLQNVTIMVKAILERPYKALQGS